jgi:hypothetical protein
MYSSEPTFAFFWLSGDDLMGEVVFEVFLAVDGEVVEAIFECFFE